MPYITHLAQVRRGPRYALARVPPAQGGVITVAIVISHKPTRRHILGARSLAFHLRKVGHERSSSNATHINPSPRPRHARAKARGSSFPTLVIGRRHLHTSRLAARHVAVASCQDDRRRHIDTSRLTASPAASRLLRTTPCRCVTMARLASPLDLSRRCFSSASNRNTRRAPSPRVRRARRHGHARRPGP